MVHSCKSRAAGAIVVGKTNTPEFGYKGVTDNVPFGASKNPWNKEFTPGGSSGGSSAALAAGMPVLLDQLEGVQLNQRRYAGWRNKASW